MTSTIAYRPDGNNLLDALGQLAEAGGEGVHPSVEVRRTARGFPDAALVIPDRSWADGEGGRRLLDAIETTRAYSSLRRKGQRVTLRVADAVIAQLGGQLEAGAPVGMDGDMLLAGTSWLVDFCDPNATKALHVGHLRNLVIGNALVSALAAAGGGVTRQSVVCDIGRNVAEAMAGYLEADPADASAADALKSDVRVGRWYADYVRRSLDTHSLVEDLTPDAPLSRELDLRDDLAQRLLMQWIAGDREVRRVWDRVRNWVLAGQEATLARLGIAFDRLRYESEAFPLLAHVVQEGLQRGLFTRTTDGALHYATGLQEYPVVPLIRSDGFPTEHMRALVLWYALPSAETTCVHVMGDEWVPSTVQRELMLEALLDAPRFAAYHKIACAMVSLRGSKMKSSDGEVILIDALLDTLCGSPQIEGLCATQDREAREIAARIVVAGFFLGRPVSKLIEFSEDRFNDPSTNQGWVLARAWARSRGPHGSGASGNPQDPAYRYAVLQSQLYRRMLSTVVSTLDLAAMMRYLVNLSTWYLEEERTPGVDRVVSTILTAGLASLGIATDLAPPWEGSRGNGAAVGKADDSLGRQIAQV